MRPVAVTMGVPRGNRTTKRQLLAPTNSRKRAAVRVAVAQWTASELSDPSAINARSPRTHTGGGA